MTGVWSTFLWMRTIIIHVTMGLLFEVCLRFPLLLNFYTAPPRHKLNHTLSVINLLTRKSISHITVGFGTACWTPQGAVVA